MKPLDSPKQPFDWDDHVRRLFGALTRKYDLGNALISFGMHMRWKKALIVGSRKLMDGCRMLDAAAGTGDIAILAKKLRPTALVFGVDFSPQMVEFAQRRADRALGNQAIEFRLGDLQALEGYPTGEFDLVTIGFGLRNVANRERALSEIQRVLVTGGVLAILDLSKPMPAPIRPFAWLLLRCAMPVFSFFYTGRFSLYLWLLKSLQAYPSYSELKLELENCGFHNVRLRRFALGFISAVYVTA